MKTGLTAGRSLGFSLRLSVFGLALLCACTSPSAPGGTTGGGAGASPGPRNPVQAECPSAQGTGTPPPNTTYRNQYERNDQQVRGTLHNLRNQQIREATLEFAVKDPRGAQVGAPQRIEVANIAPCGQSEYSFTLNTAVPRGGNVTVNVALQR